MNYIIIQSGILFQIEDPENTNVFLNNSILGCGIYSWDDISVLECISEVNVNCVLR